MIDALFNQPSYVATKKMMDATVLRHEAIARNLENIETPNYKRIDVAPNFASELQNAMASNDPNKISSLTPTLSEDSNAISASKDGNTVQLESEMLNLNRNTMDHALETELVSQTFFKLRMAITGRS